MFERYDMLSNELIDNVFAKRQIEKHRRANRSLMPDWLREHRNSYRDKLIEGAKKNFERTGIWFLARGESRDTDEQETVAVWKDLLFFESLKNLPYYSKENHKKAVDFWKSWQNLQTGRLYNPLYQNPQKPEEKRHTPGNRNDYSPEKINLKYIPLILEVLDGQLPIPCKLESYSENTKDTFDQMWGYIEKWSPSRAGIFPINAAYEVEQGNFDKSPQVEAGISALLRHHNSETGMWSPKPLENFPWQDYHPSSGFKIISRICGYIGMENFPENILKTAIDNLLAHKKDLYWKHPAQARNYGEMMAHYVVMTDYRKDELIDAMELCLGGFKDTELWQVTETSCYCIFGSSFIGAFMNWEDLPVEQAVSELMRFQHGCKMKYRFVAGPYGNWVNVIPKEPEEIFGHPEYDLNKYSLKARNRAHWFKKITDVIPQKNIPIELSSDKNTGKGVFEFNLEKEQLVNRGDLMLKATWSGSYDVCINGHLVKKVHYNFPDLPAGWHIPKVAVESLCENNKVQARLIDCGKEQSSGSPLSGNMPFINIGLICWS